MDALSAHLPFAIDADRGPAHLAPDGAGQNFYVIGRGLRDLLPLYLAAEDFSKLEPHFDRLGTACRRPARRVGAHRRSASTSFASARPLRARRGLDRLPYVLPRDGKYRLRRFRLSCHEPPRRRARHGSSAAGCRQIRAAISVRAGRIRPDVPDQRDRHVDPPDPQVRKQGAAGLPAAENAVGRRRHDVEGHAVHDRARRRLRCRRDRDHRALRGRRVAALRRQMVLLACRRRCRTDAGAPGGCGVRHQGASAVRAAAPAEERPPQRLSDRAAEGQARHPLDGEWRNSARKARSPISSATSMPG